MLSFKLLTLLMSLGLCMNKPIIKTFESYLEKRREKLDEMIIVRMTSMYVVDCFITCNFGTAKHLISPDLGY